MRLTENIQGAALMTASMSAFTINDAFLKLLGVELPFFQILFLRSIGVVLLFAAMLRIRGGFSMPPSRRDRLLIGVRCLAEIGAAYFFITALFHMPLANVSAILQSLPLAVTLGAALFLGEPVGWRRFMAIAVGFAGVMLIVRPGGSDFTLHSLYAVGAVFCVTVRDLAARRLSYEVSSITVAFAAAVAVLMFTGIGAVFTEWKPMTSTHWVWLAASTIFILGGYLFSVMAMRVGEIGAVAPFRYSSLVVALILGLVVFGDWPDNLTLTGAAIVVSMGLFTLWRETRMRRPTATAKQT